MEIDLEFCKKRIHEQYMYLEKLKSQHDTMNPERFTLLWTSACDILSYFLKKQDDLSGS